MKTLDPGFEAHVESGATTLCNCWRIVRADGFVLGFTDHDVALSFGGTDYVPAHGLDGGEATAKLGPQVDTAEVVGVLHSDAIAEDDILLGRYDGAMVESWRVNWRNVEERDRLRRSTIGEIVREDGVFRAELRSAQHALNQPKGRMYQALCDARVGDARCGIDLEDPAYRASATVATIRDRYRLEVTGIDGFDEGWFGFGKAVWAGGRRAGLTDQVVSHTRVGGADILAFAAPVGDWVETGDALLAYAGCDRRFLTCRASLAMAATFAAFRTFRAMISCFAIRARATMLDGRALF